MARGGLRSQKQDAMGTRSRDNKSPLISTVFPLISFFWTVCIAGTLAWHTTGEYHQTTATMLSQSRSFFKQIVTTRYWNSLHGGVYVLISERTPPNPFLEVPNRGITTRDGLRLTMINPAYMTRQIAEIASHRDQVQFHITSLNPIRPANAPAEWEFRALTNFSNATDEHYEWWEAGGDEGKYFRYIAPLWTEQPCLKCHAAQGYSEGDLRGGISVSIPADQVISDQNTHIRKVVLGYLTIWFLGLAGVFMAYRLISREYRKRSALIEKLQNAHQEVRTLQGFIPICAWCKRVRNDEGFWDQIESYIRDRSEADFSHCICPDCLRKFFPDHDPAENNDEENNR